MLHTFPLRLIDIQRLFYLDSFEYRCIYIFFSFTRFPIRFHSILLVSTIIITTYVHPWLLIQFFPLRVNKSIDEIKKEKKEKILYLFSNWNKKKKKREGSKWLARFLIKRDKVNFAARLPSTNWPYSEGGRGLFRVVSLERACSKDGRERRRRRRSKTRAKFVTVHTVKTPFFRERRRRRRFLLNKIKYQVIVPERRKAAIRRSLSTSFSKPAPSLFFFSSFLFFILLFKARLSGRKFLSRKDGDVFQRGGPCVQWISLVATTRFDETGIRAHGNSVLWILCTGKRMVFLKKFVVLQTFSRLYRRE